MSDAPDNPWRYILSDITIGAEEIERVTEVLDSAWLTQGPVCREFEERFADLIGAPSGHTKVMSSCTGALHVSLAALGIGPDDEVIVPSLSFVATANCVRYVGAKPVFADVIGVDDLTIDPDDVIDKLSPRTRAVICVHYAGYPARLEELIAICKQNNLFLVEDVAHAPGASLKGKGLGTWGDVGCFSFFSNKNIAMGEGGLVATRDPALAEKIGRMRSHGMTSVTLDRHKGHSFSYDVVELGYNFRLSEVSAAIGLAQLDRFSWFSERRRILTNAYRERLVGVKGIYLPFSNAEGVSAHHIFPSVLDPGINRYHFMSYLKQRGIQTSIHYPPIHLFSDFRNSYGTGDGMLPRTEDIAAREVTLPLHPKLSVEDIDDIVFEVKQALVISQSED